MMLAAFSPFSFLAGQHLRQPNSANLCVSRISALLREFGSRDGQASLTGVRPEAPDMNLEMTGLVPIAAERVRQPRVVCLVSGPFQAIARGELSNSVFPAHRRAFSGKAFLRRA